MKHYTFIDYATQGYIALVAAFILLLHGNAVPGWGWLVAAHLVCLGLVHGLIHAHAPSLRARDFQSPMTAFGNPRLSRSVGPL